MQRQLAGSGPVRHKIFADDCHAVYREVCRRSATMLRRSDRLLLGRDPSKCSCQTEFGFGIQFRQIGFVLDRCEIQITLGNGSGDHFQNRRCYNLDAQTKV